MSLNHWMSLKSEQSNKIRGECPRSLSAWTKGTLLNVQKLGKKGVSQKFKNLNEKECPFCSRRG